ncbi:hypothetical protein KP509_03G020500 [Ceratopteris richardii]|nr:hypothetical protein KP509_03G020500 [Ceratopteris richardii]
MVPIGFIQSCFTTRNGTPRQPLLVPLARACLILPPEGVPATAFDGLTGYSHCWLVYIFHANTDLPHIWNQPSHKEFKAKVRVPRLDGGKLGVFATRTPHRPCPIGLSVAKVEGVYGRMLLLSGVDLVDGTPVLDVKPYLPYCDIVGNATAPSWVKAGDEDDVIALASVEFSPRFEKELGKNWGAIVKLSMYSSPEEFQALISQVLSRDIRSLRQRKHPRPSTSCASVSIDEDHGQLDFLSSEDATAHSWLESEDKSASEHNAYNVMDAVHDGLVVYRLTLEGVVISYIVDSGHVTVEGIDVPNSTSGSVRECNYSTWMKVLQQECTDTIWA